MDHGPDTGPKIAAANRASAISDETPRPVPLAMDPAVVACQARRRIKNPNALHARINPSRPLRQLRLLLGWLAMGRLRARRRLGSGTSREEAADDGLPRPWVRLKEGHPWPEVGGRRRQLGELGRERRAK